MTDLDPQRDPEWEQFDKLWATIRGMPQAVVWGTVTQSSPLRVRLDGEAEPIPFTPATVQKNIPVGARVLCVKQNLRVIILAVASGDTGWVDLSSYVSTGITYVADADDSLKGIRAKRVGQEVTLSLGNFQVDSLSVPAHGNISNRRILDPIPVQFRPLGGAAISAAWNGRVWAGFVRPDGTVYMSAVAPRASAPDPDTWTNEMFSGTARYLAAN